MSQAQRGADLVSSARQSANRLIEEANGLTVFRWLDDAGDEGRDLYNRVRQLHDIARDVEVALRAREEQLQDEGNKRLRGEDVVWKNTKAHLERCHHILNKLRRLLIGWDAEFEPTRAQTLALQMRLSFVQRRRIASLHNKLNWQFKALQLNTQAVNQFMQIDTQARIGLAQERLDETNARISRMSDMIMEHMRQTYEQQQAMYEQQRTLINAIQNGLGSPAFSISSATTPISVVAPAVTTPSQPDDNANPITIVADSIDDDNDDTDDTEDELGDDRADRRVMRQALEETRSVLRNPFASRRGSSVALETSYTGSDASTSEYNPRSQRRLSSTGNQNATLTAGDYANFIAQFPKKPEEDYDDLLKDYNNRARTFLKQKKYDLAEENLIQAMQIARDRQKFYGTAFDESSMQDLLGQIYMQGKRFQKALGVWVELLPRVNDDPDQVITLQHCHHFQLVAEVFYRMWRDKKQRGQDAREDLMDAWKNADSAYNKRCEILGKAARSSPEVHLSADLLGRIHEALGNSADATFYYNRANGVANPNLDDLDVPERDIDGEVADGQMASNELYKAIRQNNVPRALALLNNKNLDFDLDLPLPKEWSKEKLTMLMIAFNSGSEPVVKALLERNANIGAKDSHGRTVVHRAAASGDAKMAYLAVRSGKKGSLEQTDKYGLTPLLLAVAENKPGVVEVVDTLLAEEANLYAVDSNEDNIIHLAAKNSSKTITGRSEVTSRAYDLLKSLVTNERITPPINSGNNVGNTPLMLACENGHARTAELLIKNGAQVNMTNNSGQSALWLAIDEHALLPPYEDTVRILLGNYAEVNEKELPRKWKDFRHLANKSSLTAGGDGSPGAVRATTSRGSSGSRSGHQRNDSVGNDSLRPSMTRIGTGRRESAASNRTTGRQGSVSTMNTTTSRGSSVISRLFSFSK